MNYYVVYEVDGFEKAYKAGPYCCKIQAAAQRQDILDTGIAFNAQILTEDEYKNQYKESIEKR